MDEGTRACIAYIAGALVNKNCGNVVYDHSRSMFISISGSVEGNHVNIYDHDRDSYITGAISNLYDFCRNSTISLSVKGNQIYGYDHGDGHDFWGTVNGNSVDVFHHETSFSYSL
jgi:hypothetical protein